MDCGGFAFALFMPAFIISTTAGKQELEKGQARDVGDTCLSCVDSTAEGHTQTGTLQPFSGHCAVATRNLCGTRSGRACSQKGL